MISATADDLALLRAGCEWAGQEQVFSGAFWTFMVEWPTEHTGIDSRILSEPYASNLLGALLARLRKDGWAFGVVGLPDGQGHTACFRAWLRPCRFGLTEDGGEHPDSPLLALLYAMRDAGIIRTEARA